MNRIRIMQDDDCHTYFVSVGQEKAFNAYVDSEGELDMPDGVERLGSHLSCYTFADPREER